jgi:hypothetical protein
MPSLFENAVASIRMGVEDYRQQDTDRDVSAVRNFYAGVLLLAKEALVRKAPEAEPKDVIGTSYKPVPDGDGGVEYETVGGKTIDFNTIAGRFKDFGMFIDHNALKDLNRIRNDVEHHYTDKPEAAVRTALAKGFPVAASLFRQMEEDPAILLGEIWSVMLETRELYEHELKEAKATLVRVQWHSETVSTATFKCTDCESELMEQLDPENSLQHAVEFRCRSCQATPEVGDVIEATIENAFAFDAYTRAKETGEEGPIYQCPACERDCYVETEDSCANCNESLDYESECMRCSNGISIQEFLDGNDTGLCGYCSYVADKVMRE